MKRGYKRFSIPSEAHERWHNQALPQILGKRRITSKIESIEIVFFPKTRRAFDLTNYAESVMDLLVDAGIIEDDKYTIVPRITLQVGEVDKLNPRVEVTIYENNPTHPRL